MAQNPRILYTILYTLILHTYAYFFIQIYTNLCVFTHFLLMHIYTSKISHKYHEKDENDLLLQSKTAILSIIAALIELYIVIKNYNKNNLNIAEIESI